MDGRYERKKQQTNDALKRAFYELSDKGKNQLIKATDVCQKAGIARSTFYSHYECYEDFVKETADELIEDAKSALTGYGLLPAGNEADRNRIDLDYIYYVGMDGYLTFLRENQERFLAFISPAQNAYFISRYRELIKAAVAFTTHQSDEKKKLDPLFDQWVADAVMSTMFLWIRDESIDRTALMDLASRLRNLFASKSW